MKRGPRDVDALFEQNVGPLAKTLDIAVRAVAGGKGKLHSAGRKGRLGHIYISFLLSSVLCKLPWLRIDLYGENGRLGTSGRFAEWDVPDISEALYLDAAYAAAQQEDVLRDYEIERNWIESADEYFKAFERFMPRIIRESQASQEISCRWHFGHFYGSSVTVFEGIEDEIL